MATKGKRATPKSKPSKAGSTKRAPTKPAQPEKSSRPRKPDWRELLAAVMGADTKRKVTGPIAALPLEELGAELHHSRQIPEGCALGVQRQQVTDMALELQHYQLRTLKRLNHPDISPMAEIGSVEILGLTAEVGDYISRRQLTLDKMLTRIPVQEGDGRPEVYRAPELTETEWTKKYGHMFLPAPKKADVNNPKQPPIIDASTSNKRTR